MIADHEIWMWYHLRAKETTGVSESKERREERTDKNEPERRAKSYYGQQREVHDGPGLEHNESVDWVESGLIPEEDDEQGDADEDRCESLRLSPSWKTKLATRRALIQEEVRTIRSRSLG